MKKILLLIAGWLSLITELIGIVLRLLPIIPFLLLAALCFSHSSTRMHDWLSHHPWFGPPIHQWQQSRSVTRNTKNKALLLLLISFTASLVLMPLPLGGTASLLLLALAPIWFVARLPEKSRSKVTLEISHYLAVSASNEER